ncbi:MAG: fimbrillin family protein [Bacteroidales bacterium]|nr:fimbrillin family protein [Bacteroidales bacterium]
MKKILVIFGLFAAIVSCSKTNVNEGEPERIGFDTYALRTKAGDSYIGGNGGSTTNIPVNSKFGVFAYFHPGDASTSTVGTWNNADVNSNYSNMLLNEPVTRVEPSTGTYAYTYSNSRYWPKNSTDRISFFAYYPYAENAFVVDENATSDGTGITLQDPEDDHYGYSHNPVGFPKFKFVVNPDASKQVDFMISDMCMNQNKVAGVTTGNDNEVQFTFHHMLSQIRVKTVDFVVENDDIEVELESVRFLGIPVSGIVTPSIRPADLSGSGQPTTPNGYAHMNYNWTGLNTSNSSFSTTVYDDTASDAEKQAAIMLMIPHTFSEDPGKDVIEVTFKVTRAENVFGEYYSYTGHLSASLKAGGLEGWERNKIYNYTISVSLNAIDFTAVVEDWPEASTDVNTIKVHLEQT